jgi:hypothetical protein
VCWGSSGRSVDGDIAAECSASAVDRVASEVAGGWSVGTAVAVVAAGAAAPRALSEEGDEARSVLLKLSMTGWNTAGEGEGVLFRRLTGVTGGSSNG